MVMDVPKISFAGGVISPAAFARVDLQKWGSAVKTADNFFMHAEGGTSNRAGLQFIKGVKNNPDTVRLITFEFNEEQAYALEFGDQYIRIIKDGGIVLETGTSITGATQANPVVITSAAHGLEDGDEVYITGAVGMTELNNKFFTVANKTLNDFELSGVDGTGYTAYTSGGTVARVYTLTTSYADGDLALLKFRQSNDVMYLTHRSYAPRKLTRTGDAAWTLTVLDFEPDQAFPTGITVSPQGAAGSTTYRYRVTAVNNETGEESLVGTGATAVISGATQADPVVVTATAHGYSSGEVHLSSIVGMTELNGRRFIIGGVTANTFELVDEDGTGHTAYASGGNADQTFGITTTGNAALSDTNYNQITLTAPAGDLDVYNVYKEDNGLYGFIGSLDASSTPQFDDKNLAADLEDTAPKWRQPFSVAGDYPGAVGIHEQRTAWGNSDNDPLKVWLSQTSQFENMNVSSPTKPSDAVTLRIVTGQGNEVRHFRSFQERLFIFTSGLVWTLRPGGNADAITPSSKKLGEEEYLSSTNVPPLAIKKNLLMIAGKENVGFEVHSLGYNLENDSYAGSDLTALARDLFVTHTIQEWAFAERPYRLLACVREDGALLIMTYLQEHRVFAWSVWKDPGGDKFKSVCSVPEGQEDALYFVMERTINGGSVKYIERLHTRVFSQIKDAFFVDSGLTLDITDPKTITGATQANPVVVTSNAHGYEDGDKIFITDVVGMAEINSRLFTVANKTANTYELAAEDGTGHTAYTSGGLSQKKVTALSGLDHLERETLIALADGNL